MANKYLDDVGLTHLWTKIKDYVSANSNKYTLPTATTSTLGGVKLGSDTVQTVAAVNPTTAIRSRTYAIQKNSDGQLVVNVPWTDTKPHAEAADIIYWNTEANPQLIKDLIRIFNTNDEVNYSRAATTEEGDFFETIMSEIRGGRRISGIYICSSASILNSGLIAYLQLSLINQITITFTVYNLEQTGTPTYGYIVEYSNGGLFIAKTQLATKYDLGSYATRTSVQEVKNAVDKIKDRITYITYADLKALRDNGNLIPGQQYQITDYITTVNPNDSDIQSAGHQFDIIVVADNAFTLNENARATLHVSNNEKIEWPTNTTLEDVQVLFKVTPEDDYLREPSEDIVPIQVFTTRFNTSGQQVPVIINTDPEGSSRYYNTVVDIKYVMYDDGEDYTEWIDNHKDVIVELDYDDNNIPILYKTNPLNADTDGITDVDYGDVLRYYDDYVLDGVTYNRWEKFDGDERYPIYLLTNLVVKNNVFTITQDRLTNGIDFEYVPSDFDAIYYYSGLYNFDGEVYNIWLEKEDDGGVIYGVLTKKIFNINIDSSYFNTSKLEAWQLKYSLDNSYTWSDPNGKGIIYWMKDEYNNECSYDFKNIMFYRSDSEILEGYYYTFSYYYDASLDKILDASIFGNDGTLLDDGDSIAGVTNNIIKRRNKNQLNNIVFYSCETYDSGYYYGCNNNIFEENCYKNTFLDSCNRNYFSVNCCYNYFYADCENNFLGIDSNNIVLSNYSKNNYFKQNCSNINLELMNSNGNYFGINCKNIALKKAVGCIFDNNISFLTTNCNWENIYVESGVQYVDIETQRKESIYNATFSSGIKGTYDTRKFVSANEAIDNSKTTKKIYRSYSTTEILLD